MRKTFIITIFTIFYFGVLAQQNARNGYHFPTKGTLRVLVVYAQVDTATNLIWTDGELPPNPDRYFDHEFTTSANIQGEVTEFFHDASFGELKFLGDYYEEPIIVSNYSVKSVIAKLDSIPETDLITANGYSVNSGDFDDWNIDYSPGKLDSNIPDDNIDFLVIIWNCDDGGGTVVAISSYTNNNDYSIKYMKGINGYTSIKASFGDIWQVLYHEYSHTLFGGNDFHSGGANYGDGTFLGDFSGYSMLSGWNRNNDFVNAWDRWRLGWKQAGKRYYIIV